MIKGLIGLFAEPKVKIIAIAVIGIGLFAAVRWYGNKQWAKGETAGRQYVADRLSEEKEKEWEERERQIEETKALMELQTEILNKAAGEIIAARVDLRNQYNALTVKAAAQRNADEKIIASVPDSDLRAAIRNISNSLSDNRTGNTGDSRY